MCGQEVIRLLHKFWTGSSRTIENIVWDENKLDVFFHIPVEQYILKCVLLIVSHTIFFDQRIF